jgi:transcriptional regulator with GAF, ATPase, and Fis domain
VGDRTELTPFVSAVWREACRHIEIEDSVGRIAQLLEAELPAELVLVRRLDPRRACVETVAVAARGPVAVPEASRTDLTPGAMQELVAWCARRTVIRRRAVAGDDPLLPPGIEGDVLAGPLLVADAPAGVLVLVARPGKSFSEAHAVLAQSLLDPFSTALENDQRLREIRTLREAAEADKLSLLARLGRQSLQDTIVGSDAGLKPVMERVDQVARSDVPVLILGETGSGKEVISRAIHDRSSRRAGPFLRVNCGAITPELIDSELFGHERGSFTGAVASRKGWFERADGGTLLLDEIGELPLAAQVRLLRILQDGSFERVGGERTLHVDVRIIAATHRDLRSMSADGRFREDLWYRIAVFPIHLPPLRERLEDIALLAHHFAVRASRHFGTRPLAPSAEDLRLLASYSWPGNIRELAAVIDRATILGDGTRLEIAKALGPVPGAGPSTAATSAPASAPALAPSPRGDELPTLDELTSDHIRKVLAKTNGRIEGPYGAARILGINPHTLRARMRKLGIPWQRFRDASPGASVVLKR